MELADQPLNRVWGDASANGVGQVILPFEILAHFDALPVAHHGLHIDAMQILELGVRDAERFQLGVACVTDLDVEAGKEDVALGGEADACDGRSGLTYTSARDNDHMALSVAELVVDGGLFFCRDNLCGVGLSQLCDLSLGISLIADAVCVDTYYKIRQQVSSEIYLRIM